jgi:thioredoxin-like negative regulator of GroEL
VKTDDNATLREEYSIDVVPTVIFFKNGAVAKRLDGLQGVGLDEKQLIDFAGKC